MLGFDFAIEQVVPGLQTVEPCPIPPVTNSQRQCDLPGGKVGAADVSNFPLANQGIECFESFFDGCIRVGGVGLVEIDVVGLQSAQAIFGGFQNMLAAQSLVVGSVPNPHSTLGR